MDVVLTVATVVLVLITGWYAFKTHEMASTARDAAADSLKAIQAAERAAEAARDSSHVAQSQVRVEFTGRAVAAHAGEQDWISALVIQSIADAVVIQEVRVRRAFRESEDEMLDPKSELVGEILTPFNNESSLPRRLHADEDLVVSHAALQDQGLDIFNRFIIDIDYTFAEAGAAGGKRRLVVTR